MSDGSLEIRLRLDADDLTLLRERLLHALTLGEHESEGALLDAALAVAVRASGTHAPGYVRRQMIVLEDVGRMLRDPDWQLPRSVRDRVRVVLCYFLEAADLIPDDAPLFGYLDDAIMIDLLARELRDELDAHARFARFRDRWDERHGAGAAGREQALATRRRALRARVQERRARAEAGPRERWFRTLVRALPTSLRGPALQGPGARRTLDGK